MTFEQFLNKVVPKIGPKSAFDLAKDARISALEKIIIEKTGTSKEKIDTLVDEEFDKLADMIIKMPPLPGNKS